MLKDIIVKKAKDILGSLDTKVVGSNKSKANLPIIDRIKKYYLEHAKELIEFVENTNEEKKEKLEASIEDHNNKINEGIYVENNGAVLNKLSNEVHSEVKKLNKRKNNEVLLSNLKTKIDNELQPINDKEALINEINKANEPIPQTPDHEVKFDLELASQIKENNKKGDIESTDIKVEEEMKNVEEELKNTVNSINEPIEEKVENPVEKSQVEMAKDNMIDVVNQLTSGLNEEVKTTIEKTSEDLINSFTTFFQNISVAYETKLDEQAKSYEEKLEVQKENDKVALNQYAEKSQSILAAAEKDSKEKSAKINELTTTNNALTSNLETANNTIVSKDKEISDLNDKVTSLNSTIEANKLEMSAKDQEIARLKVFEQRWMLMSQAMAPVTQEVPTTTEETTKTI